MIEVPLAETLSNIRNIIVEDITVSRSDKYERRLQNLSHRLYSIITLIVPALKSFFSQYL